MYMVLKHKRNNYKVPVTYTRNQGSLCHSIPLSTDSTYQYVGICPIILCVGGSVWLDTYHTNDHSRYRYGEPC